MSEQLSFADWAGSLDRSHIVIWEQVLLTGTSDVTFDDTLVLGTGPTSENATDDLLFQVDGDAIARFQSSFAIAGNVNNLGIMTAQNGSVGDAVLAKVSPDGARFSAF